MRIDPVPARPRLPLRRGPAEGGGRPPPSDGLVHFSLLHLCSATTASPPSRRNGAATRVPARPQQRALPGRPRAAGEALKVTGSDRWCSDAPRIEAKKSPSVRRSRMHVDCATRRLAPGTGLRRGPRTRFGPTPIVTHKVAASTPRDARNYFPPARVPARPPEPSYLLHVPRSSRPSSAPVASAEGLLLVAAAWPLIDLARAVAANRRAREGSWRPSATAQRASWAWPTPEDGGRAAARRGPAAGRAARRTRTTRGVDKTRRRAAAIAGARPRHAPTARGLALPSRLGTSKFLARSRPMRTLPSPLALRPGATAWRRRLRAAR